MSIPTTRPSVTIFASRRDSHPAPHPTSSTLSAGASRIFSSTGSVMGRWSCSIPSPRPASAQRLNSSRREDPELGEGMRSESEQVSWNEFLCHWVHHEAQNFESRRAKDCLLTWLSESNRHRSFSSVNGHEHGCCVTFESAAVCKRKRQPREGLHTEFFQRSPRNQRQRSTCVHQQRNFFRPARSSQVRQCHFHLKHSHCWVSQSPTRFSEQARHFSYC